MSDLPRPSYMPCAICRLWAMNVCSSSRSQQLCPCFCFIVYMVVLPFYIFHINIECLFYKIIKNRWAKGKRLNPLIMFTPLKSYNVHELIHSNSHNDPLHPLSLPTLLSLPSLHSSLHPLLACFPHWAQFVFPVFVWSWSGACPGVCSVYQESHHKRKLTLPILGAITCQSSPACTRVRYSYSWVNHPI